MDERRLDPRTDARYSLRNLLVTRARTRRFSLALIGTGQGVLMAASREDRAAERVAAHAAQGLLQGGGAARLERSGPRTGGRLRALRFLARGEPLVLAVLDDDARAQAPGELEELAARAGAILSG